MHLSQTEIEAIQQLAEKFNVRSLAAFGSVTRSDFNAQSDIDLLVDFNRTAHKGAFKQYFGFKHALEQTLGRKVDLVCKRAIRNPIFKRTTEQTQELLYAAKH